MPPLTPQTRIENFLDGLSTGVIPDYPDVSLSREERFLKAACESYKYLVEHKLDATFIKNVSPTTTDKGQIGQFWYNTVTGELYVLIDIDDTDPANPVYFWDLISSGSGSMGIFVGYVTNGGSFPTTRLDGSPLQEEDYVRPLSTSTFPFTIDSVTFITARDKAVYTGTTPAWVIDPGVVQTTAETPVYDPTSESHSGTAGTQKVVNQENKLLINSKVDKTTDTSKVYITDSSGAQSTQSYAIGANPSTFAVRGGGGRLSVGEPTSDQHATTKKYVDDHEVYNANSNFTKDLTGTTDKITLLLRDTNNTEMINKTLDFDDKLVLADKTQTIKNKTIDADDNTISDLKTTSIAADTLVDSTEVTTTTLEDTQLLTAKAVKTIADSESITVEKQATAETGYAATYVLKKGAVELSPKINIPLDYLVKNGKVSKVTVYAPATAYSAGDVINHATNTYVVLNSITAADNTQFSDVNTALVGLTAATGSRELVLYIGTKTGTAAPEYCVFPIDDINYTAGSAIDIDSDARVIKVKVDNSTIAINGSNNLEVKDGGLTKVKGSAEFWTDNSFTGTTNAENIVVSGDLTSNSDASLNNVVVTSEIDVPIPTEDSHATNKKYVDEAIGKTFRFTGYVATTAPTGAKTGELWYEGSAMPTTFPVQVKTYDGTVWSSTTTPYTAATMDLWANKEDNHGYYWFGNAWNKIDFNATVDDVTIHYNGANQLAVKDEGISLDKMEKHTTAVDMVYTIEADGTTGLEKCRQYVRVHSFASLTGDERTAYYLDTPYIVGPDVYEIGIYVWTPSNGFELVANTGTGGGVTPIFVGEVSNGDVFPGARPDGSPLIIGDYVKPYAGSTFPFTIGTVTFTNARDTAVFMGSGNWLINASVYQKTNETPVNNKTYESINGAASTAVYQADINNENSTAINAAAKTGSFSKTSDGKVHLEIKDRLNNNIINEDIEQVVFTEDNQILKNKTIDADDNTILDITGLNLKNQAATDVKKTWVIQADGTWALGKAGDDVDNVTIGLNASDQLEVKDQGVTFQKMNDAAVSQTIVETGASTNKLTSENAVRVELDKKQDIIQYAVMPTASASLVGKIYQYIGNTSLDYTNGFFYICIEDITTSPTSYKWVRKTVQNDNVDGITINRNSTDELQVKDAGLTKAKTSAEFWTDNAMTGTTNAENIIVSGDLTSNSDASLNMVTVSGEIDVPTPTANNHATTKKYVDDAIEDSKRGFKFVGYVTTTEPTGELKKGELWYNSSDTTMPTTFPIQVKTYDGTSWSSTTEEYTPTSMDLWSNKNNNHGYYWFGNEWNMIDATSGNFVQFVTSMPPASEFNNKTILYDGSDMTNYKKGHLYQRTEYPYWSVECQLTGEPTVITLYSAEELSPSTRKKLYSNSELTIESGYWATSSTMYNSPSEPSEVIGSVFDQSGPSSAYHWSEVQPTQETILSIFNVVYPVGSYYFGNSHPTLGVWEQIEGDRAIWIKNSVADGTSINQALPKPTITSTFTGSSATSNSTGSHTHTFTGTSGTTSSNGEHTHTRGTMEITGKLGSICNQNGTASGAFSYSRDNSAELSGSNQSRGTWTFTASNNWTGETSSNGAHTHTLTPTGTNANNGAHTHTVTAKGSVSSSVNTAGVYGTGTKVQPDAIVMTVWKRVA